MLTRAKCPLCKMHQTRDYVFQLDTIASTIIQCVQWHLSCFRYSLQCPFGCTHCYSETVSMYQLLTTSLLHPIATTDTLHCVFCCYHVMHTNISNNMAAASFKFHKLYDKDEVISCSAQTCSMSHFPSKCWKMVPAVRM